VEQYDGRSNIHAPTAEDEYALWRCPEVGTMLDRDVLKPSSLLNTN
jgi:hypothetical protein